jgi:lysozyme
LLLPRQGELACLDLGQSVSEAVMQRLKISREGVILIKSFEGFRPRALRRDDGRWVIGYGHTLSAREGAAVSEADAELLLQYDLIPVAKAVNEGVAAPLNQHQFDALASFAFSVGVDRFQSSDVLSRLNAGFAGEAADAMIGWPEPVLPETALRRRAAERALFVANPAWPVALADLLAAPLPPPVVTPLLQTASGPVEAPAGASDESTVPDAWPEALTTSTPVQTDAPEPEVPSEYVAPDGVSGVDETWSARHAAVASLLADPDPVLHQPEPEAVAGAEAATTGVSESGAAAETVEPEAGDAASIEAEPAPAAPDAPDVVAEAVSDVVSEEAPPADPAPASPRPPFAFAGTLPMQRYSGYSGAIVGPLPGAAPGPLTFAPPPAAQPETASIPPASEMSAAASEVEPDGGVDAVPEAPVSEAPVSGDFVSGIPVEAADPFAPAETSAETPVDALPEASTETPTDAAPPTPWYVGTDAKIAAFPANPFPPLAEPEAQPQPEAPVDPIAAQDEVKTPEPSAEPNPFALAPDPFPAQPQPFEAAPRQPALELPDFGASPSAAPFQKPDSWLAISATSEPRTDGELLVLNPSPDSDVFASPRLVWPQGEHQGDETSPLFEDDGSLRLAPGNILRHETFEEVVPARIPWGELSAYGLMGGFGLVSFGMSMAAFRRASQSSSGGDGVTLIAIVLAVIGAACVGVSAYNLYRRWGRADEE